MKLRLLPAAVITGLVTTVLLAGCAAPAAPSASRTLTAAPEPTREPSAADAGEPRYLLGTLADSDGLAIIDPAVREGSAIVETIPVGAAPWAVATHVTDDTGVAYVSTAEGLAIVDLAARTRTALVPYQHQPASITYGEYRRGGLGLAVAPDGSRVYVAVNRGDGPAALEVFDTATGAFVASVDVGLRPFDVLISADGSEVYTIDHDSFTVTIVDTAALTARSVKVAPFGTVGGLGSWEKPHYGVVATDGTLLLPYQGQALAVLDPATGEYAIQPMSAQTHQHGAALTPGGQLLVAGTGAFGSAQGDPSLTIRTLSDGVELVVPLTRLHETVTYWANSHTGAPSAVLGGGYTRDGSWDGATVVDLTTLSTYEVSVPGSPQHVIPLPELADEAG